MPELAHLRSYEQLKLIADPRRLAILQPSGRPVIVFSGSHALAVERLAAELAPHVDVLTLPVGSLNGLANLRLGLGHLAGCHLLDPQGEYNLSFIRSLFPDRAVHV